MSVTDAELSAYLDDRLAPDGARRVEEALDADAQLRERFAAMKRVGQEGAELFARMDAREMPEEMSRLFQPAPSGVHRETRRRPGWHRPRRWSRPWQLPRPVLAGAAMAGLGLVATALILVRAPGPDATRTQPVNQLLVAGEDVVRGHPVHQVLEDTRSGRTVALDGHGDAKVRAVASLSFRSVGQAYCREIRLASTSGARHGLACRSDGDRWRVVASVKAGAAPVEDYTVANAATSDVIEARIDALMIGSPLDADAEAAAIRSGWQTDGR